MKTVKNEEKLPMLWYWSQPENGMDMEDCEKIAKENAYNYQKDRFVKNMYIAFV